MGTKPSPCSRFPGGLHIRPASAHASRHSLLARTRLWQLCCQHEGYGSCTAHIRCARASASISRTTATRLVLKKALSERLLSGSSMVRGSFAAAVRCGTGDEQLRQYSTVQYDTGHVQWLQYSIGHVPWWQYTYACTFGTREPGAGWKGGTLGVSLWRYKGTCAGSCTEGVDFAGTGGARAQVGGQDSRSIVAAVQGDLQRELEAIGEDREGPLACLVCKEGYLSNPEELLAAYCFCKRLPVAEAGGAAPLDSTVFDKVGLECLG